MSVLNHVFSAFSFISFVLVLIPFPWHLQAWNTGTCLYMAWTAVTTFSLFINSMVWDNHTNNLAPVWCDITSKIYIGTSVAIPAASLCINRRLYYISCVRSVMQSRAEKRRAVLIDLLIGLGIPIIVMALHYVVQGHRFDILQEVGCWPFIYNTALSYVLIFMPTLIIGLISGTYSVMTILMLRKRSVELKEVLSSSSVSVNRYVRLMALAGLEAVACVPTVISTMVIASTRGEVQPWISWYETHWGFSRVDQIPSILWRSSRMTSLSVEVTRGLPVACGLIFFAFFGFSDEARTHYKLLIKFVANRMGYTVFTGSIANARSGISSSFGNRLPENRPSTPAMYICKEVVTKRESLDGLSSVTSFDDVDYIIRTSDCKKISNSKSDSRSKQLPPTPNLEMDQIPNPNQHIITGPPYTPSIYSISSAPYEMSFAVHRRSISSFPASVTPGSSFLDLTSTDLDIPSKPTHDIV